MHKAGAICSSSRQTSFVKLSDKKEECAIGVVLYAEEKMAAVFGRRGTVEQCGELFLVLFTLEWWRHRTVVVKCFKTGELKARSVVSTSDLVGCLSVYLMAQDKHTRNIGNVQCGLLLKETRECVACALHIC